ncbi:MAG: 5-(carboxyamino)imidazole ribonucleotide mutase [Gammaproteobacteria bacterium]|nr:MAG: 5-(carboxyamino)imidazole ribonucleotide mutase [Gammaproteobacteria bacterium]
MSKPVVAIVMGSKSDWPVMKKAADALKEFDIPHISRVISAHRTPDIAIEFAENAEKDGVEVIIAGAGCAAHLAGVIAGKTVLPVLGVPMESPSLKGLDSLLSTVQMPGGIPVGTLAIGDAGAKNAGLFAVAILSGKYPQLREKLKNYRKAMADKVKEIILE